MVFAILLFQLHQKITVLDMDMLMQIIIILLDISKDVNKFVLNVIQDFILMQIINAKFWQEIVLLLM